MILTLTGISQTLESRESSNLKQNAQSMKFTGLLAKQIA
jgi:hypothetical protein